MCCHIFYLFCVICASDTYIGMCTDHFSWGVFFSGLTSVFGPIWFLIHGLFGQALKWFLTNLGIGFVYKVWGLLFSHSKLDRPFNFIIGVLLIALAIYYAFLKYHF